MNKKYHYFYKITNNINGNFYYGVHNTNNLEDGYIGSGTRLHYAYKKYGVENFTKEIVKFFDTEEEAFSYEAEIVTEELVKKEECYNTSLGGKYIHNSGMACVKDCHGKNFLVSIDDDRYVEGVLSGVTSGKVVVRDYSGKYFMVNKDDDRITKGTLKYVWCGKKHCDSTRKKMKQTYEKEKFQDGEKNSQYGTCWITNGTSNMKVNKKELEEYINSGWHKGRVVSDDFRKKMSQIVKDGGLQKKEKNSQYNTKWVVKDNIEKKIPLSKLDEYISEGYCQGRKKVKK